MEIPNWWISRKKIIQPNLLDILDILSKNNLSEQEKENYEIKKEIISKKEFADMRLLTKESLLKIELKENWNFPKKRQEILEWWTNISEGKNTIINKRLIKEVILPKLEETYTEFKNKWWTSEQKKILDECYKNGLYFINTISKKTICENFRLRKCAQVARWERFLFTTNENKDKYIILEIKKITEEFKKEFKAWLEVQKTNTDINLFDDQTFFVRRHIDEGTDITKMSDILLQWKKILDHYLADKHIRYMTSCSWLFDEKFNEFWMKERAKEWKKEIPNRIKIREELKYYWWKLPDEKMKEPIENDLIPWIENSMTRAIKKYISEWNVLKEGWGYIDLEKLEKRKTEK